MEFDFDEEPEEPSSFKPTDNTEFDENDVNGWKKRELKKSGGGFQSFNLSQPLMKGIWKRGFKIPTPIQRKTIPLILDGKDVVAMARTGSGKTAAFLIPLFEKLQGIKSCSVGPVASMKYPRALILSPTRELATQTLTFFKEIGKFLKLKVIPILGGESMESQFAALHDKPDVIIATPGRFMHLCVEMEFKLDGVEYVVFDEADRLFEMGFAEQLAEVLRRLPESRQTVLFSATLPKLLVDFTKAGLRNPTLIRLDVESKLPERLKLVHFACRTEDKLATLLYLLNNEIDNRDQTIVFVATKHHVEYLHAILDELNVSNCYIYSSMDASARKSSLEKFRNGKASVMVVTDIAARGIDIPVLDNVINFHFPAKPKLFMHRVGRVARAGRNGTAYSIVSPDEIASLFDLHLFLGRPVCFSDADKAKVANDKSATFVGRIPQDLIDQEHTLLKNLTNTKNELGELNKVCGRGYIQYLKSRPSASPESNKRAKGIEVAKIPIHQTFGKVFKDDPINNLVSQMQNYKPRSTIFEIGPKAGSEGNKIMREKRLKDQKFVEKHRTLHAAEVASTSTSGDENSTNTTSTKADKNFIHYLPSDHHTEFGLSVTSAFEREIQDSVMDLTGDDSKVLKVQHSLKKWDRKRKKFVSTGQDSNSKKIKTESGAWISASYKSDRYKTWKQKSKVEDRTVDDEEPSQSTDMSRPGSHGKNRYGQNKSGFPKKSNQNQSMNTANGKSTGKQPRRGQRFRTEVKRADEILKNRKIAETKKTKNKSRKKKKR